MHDPIAYTYEASEHCPVCAFARFGRDENGYVPEDATDSEGNGVGAVAPWEAFEDRDMTCGTCLAVIHEIERDDYSECGATYAPFPTDADDVRREQERLRAIAAERLPAWCDWSDITLAPIDRDSARYHLTAAGLAALEGA